MTRNSQCALFLAVALFITFAVVGAMSQTITSTLEGKVTDKTGAVVPGASVQVKGATVTRSLVTDAEGRYRAVALPAGEYAVTVAKNGFNTQVAQQIVVLLDRTVNLDVQMEVAPRSEQVTVTADVPLIDTTTASTGQVIETRVIDSIPLNGRNYLDLIQLLPGVSNNPNAGGGSGKDTTGSILGERAGNTSYLMDGMENNDDFRGGVLQNFTQDAIQEFEVIEAGYKAEFGRGSGGVVNVITKSGTNNFHGSGFLFHRNDKLDASNVPNQGPPKLKRYNFGGTFGGPIVKDKSWFYGSLEKMQETRGSIYPPDIPPLLESSEDFSRQPHTSDLRAFGKYNQHLNQQNELRVELSWTRAILKNLLNDPVGLPSASVNNRTGTYLGKVSLTTVFNPHMFLDTSFGVRDQNFEQNQGLTNPISYGVNFLDDGTSYDFGPPIGSVQSLHQRYYTGREVLSFYAGARHSAKVGFEFIRTVADGNNGPGALQSVILTTRSMFEQYGPESFQLPQGVAFVNPGDNLSKLRNNGFSLFGQDDWKVLPKLTMSLGLRWDYDSMFNATKNFAPRFGVVFSPDKRTVIQASFGMFYDRYRIGVAQPVRELGGFNGQTVVYFDYPRLLADNLIVFPNTLMQAGMIAGDPNFLNTYFNIPVGALVTKSNIQTLTGMAPDQFLAALNQYEQSLAWPTGYSPMPVVWDPVTGYLGENQTGAFTDQIHVAKPFRTPYNNTFSVGVQREIGADVVVGASYLKRSIRDILGVRITNLSPEARVVHSPVTSDGQPINRQYGPWYSGKYDAFILTFNKRFGHRFQMMANYTYARGTDNLLSSNLGIGIATQGGASMPTDNLNLNLDRGNSDLLVPHSFVTSGLVRLPLGLNFSGVLRMTSGSYFTAWGWPGEDVDGDGIRSLTVPETKRNQFRGPITTNLDLRLEKRFRLKEHASISVLGEVFNLTNARNPSSIDNFYVDNGQGLQPTPTFGKTKTPLPGREAQFGLKFDF